MSLTDWTVIAVCLAGGYWLVSMFLDRGAVRPAQPQARETPRPPESEADAPWWDVLQVPATATMDEIQRAYRQRMSEYHPDKVATLGAELRDLAARKAKAINVAYDQACKARN